MCHQLEGSLQRLSHCNVQEAQADVLTAHEVLQHARESLKVQAAKIVLEDIEFLEILSQIFIRNPYWVATYFNKNIRNWWLNVEHGTDCCLTDALCFLILLLASFLQLLPSLYEVGRKCASDGDFVNCILSDTVTALTNEFTRSIQVRVQKPVCTGNPHYRIIYFIECFFDLCTHLQQGQQMTVILKETCLIFNK